MHRWLVWGWEFLPSCTVAQCFSSRARLCHPEIGSLDLWTTDGYRGGNCDHWRDQVDRKFRRNRRSIHVHRIHFDVLDDPRYELSADSDSGNGDTPRSVFTRCDVRRFFWSAGHRCQTGMFLERSGGGFSSHRALCGKNRRASERGDCCLARAIHRYGIGLHTDRPDDRDHRCVSDS